MMTYEEQVKMFKNMIPVGSKSTYELISFLKNKVDVEEVPLNDLPYYNLQMFTQNALYCVNNVELQLKPDDMLFHAFKVIMNEKNHSYFEEDDTEDFLFVVIEEHTKYICSNSNKLFLELELASGVSQSEYDNEGLIFRSLLSHLAIAYCEEHSLES